MQYNTSLKISLIQSYNVTMLQRYNVVSGINAVEPDLTETDSLHDLSMFWLKYGTRFPSASIYIYFFSLLCIYLVQSMCSQDELLRTRVLSERQTSN